MMCYHQTKYLMRTTLDLDEDVLAAVKELDRRHKVSIGKEVSRLVRQALHGTPKPQEESVAGFKPFPAEGRVVTNDLIDRLRDQEGV